MRYLASIAIASILACTGCFNPTYEEGIECSLDGLCPDGLQCDPVDNRCRREVLEAACDDSVQNGAETDIDCGGGGCSPCADGLGCALGSDCQSGVCDAGTCAAPECGDGVQNGDEACDTGGASPTCDADCTLAQCGDSDINTSAGEECDDAGETATCDDDCTAVSCGDGNANASAGEECDDMGESAACDADCTSAVCGDGTINPSAGETCDQGGVETIDCDVDCTPPECGDGVVNVSAGEECDTAGESATCDIDCTLPLCGDGVVNASAGEECDESGQSATCDVDCTLPVCGDGVVNTTAGEQCDDGNTMDGDGCESDCTSSSCVTANGLLWCYHPTECGRACNDTCAFYGLVPVVDSAVWFAAQDTAAECQVISDAFGIFLPVNMGGYTYACSEDTYGTHSSGGGLVGNLLCSTSPSCPDNHRTTMDQGNVACGADSRRSICPCE